MQIPVNDGKITKEEISEPDDLNNLVELRNKKNITEEEFNANKKQILGLYKE